MKGKVFKRALFGGYRKDSVYTYLSELNKKLECELAAKDALIADLTAKVATLTEQNENAGIAENIIKRAQAQAKKVADGANGALIARREHLQNQIKQEQAKLRVLQAEVAGLQRLAHDAAAKFSGELSSLDVEVAD